MNDAAVRSDLTSRVVALEAIAGRRAGDAASLAATLDLVLEALRSLEPTLQQDPAARQAAPELMWRLFDMRVHLRRRIADWQRQRLVSEPVADRLRDIFRLARTAGDLLGELHIGFRQRTDSDPVLRAFTGRDCNTFMPAGWRSGEQHDFRSGDVLLMRGTMHNSAAIARIGDIDSQFSHLAIIHVDEASKPWVVESLIEEGAIVSTLEHVLDHGLGRAVLYRHRDPRLAAEAARFIHARIKRSGTGWRRRILYDFSMQLAPYRRLFCSKLVRQAYDAASGGKLMLPTFTTRLDKGNRDFLGRIGVTAQRTFAPGDMELEPAFDLVAEWQDWRITPHIRTQDLLMTKLFAWMEEDGYTFRETMTIHLISLLGRLAANLSEEAKTMIAGVVPKVPVNMPRRTIATVAMLHKTADALFTELMHAERSSTRSFGRSLTRAEISNLLDAIRARDGGRVGFLAAPR